MSCVLECTAFICVPTFTKGQKMADTFNQSDLHFVQDIHFINASPNQTHDLGVASAVLYCQLQECWLKCFNQMLVAILFHSPQ